MKIYTKTGDAGETSLFTGKRIPKNDPFIEALGTVDECNCTLGVAVSFLPAGQHLDKVREQLSLIQHTLFDLGAALATPRTQAGETKLEKTRFSHEGIEQLERWIDTMENELPRLKTFILPSGHSCAAMLHLARSICRRAERAVVPIHQQGDISNDVFVYLNRLSDYLFVLARYVNLLTYSPEFLWQPHSSDQKSE
jgi:cob(I)alamin adenosyltransferase